MKCGKKKNIQTNTWDLGMNELQAVQPNAMHASWPAKWPVLYRTFLVLFMPQLITKSLNIWSLKVVSLLFKSHAMFKVHLCNHCYNRKAMSVKHYACVCVCVCVCVWVCGCVSGMQIASFLRRIILSSVACPSVPYFATLSQKGTIFGRRIFQSSNVYSDILYNLCLKYFSLYTEFSEVLS